MDRTSPIVFKHLRRHLSFGATTLAVLAGLASPARATDAPPVAVGPERVLSPVTTHKQENPEIGMDLAGNSVVVWQDYSQPGDSGYGIYAQRVAADGTPIGAQIHVNVTTTGEQTRPDVAVNHDGSFLVVWDDNTQRDGSGTAVTARLFLADGTPVSGELTLNQFSFSTTQRRLLWLSLFDESDEALQQALGASVHGLKKLWRGIYERIEDRAPDFFGQASAIEEGRRGPEKRRQALSYVRQRHEELRPWL